MFHRKLNTIEHEIDITDPMKFIGSRVFHIRSSGIEDEFKQLVITLFEKYLIFKLYK